ncbi:MAG: crossover junction endodeoxyribonuclease RuvC, partial [Acidimicrobiales bacterium]
MFVLGLDPGLTRCGYSVLEQRAGERPRAVALGVVRTSPGDPVPERLAELQRELRSLFDDYQPAALAVER